LQVSRQLPARPWPGDQQFRGRLAGLARRLRAPRLRLFHGQHGIVWLQAARPGADLSRRRARRHRPVPELVAVGVIESRTLAEIAVGDTASLTRPLSPDDIALLDAVSGALDPATAVADGMLLARLLHTQMPGPGTILRRQELRFLAPVRAGDAITATVTVVA